MNYWFGAEQRKHYELSQRAYDRAGELLADPRIISELGNKGLFLLGLLEYVRPTEVIRQHMREADPHDNNTIPLVCLPYGAKLHVQRTAASPMQVQSVTEYLGEQWATTYLRREHFPHVFTIKKPANAVCRATLDVIKPTSSAKDELLPLYIRGRPMIALAYDARGITAKALQVIHEMDHAAIFTRTPIQTAESVESLQLQLELSAYHTQSTVARVLNYGTDDYYPHRIENIRQCHNGSPNHKLAFEPRLEIAEHLESEGLLDISLPDLEKGN